MALLAKLPWWSALPLSAGFALMGIFAPDAFPEWIRTSLFWVGVALAFVGISAGAVHFRPKGWWSTNIGWRFRSRPPHALVPAPAAPVITPTSHKGKPLVRLTDAERDRVSQALLGISDYLKTDFAEFLRPFQEMRNAQSILKEAGGAAYHAKVEAPRPDMRAFIDTFTAALRPYQDEMLILGLSVDGIKTKSSEPLWRAVREVSNISQMLPEGPYNGEALKLPLRQLGEAVEAVQAEVDRVQNEVKIWRLRISRGEL